MVLACSLEAGVAKMSVVMLFYVNGCVDAPDGGVSRCSHWG